MNIPDRVKVAGLDFRLVEESHIQAWANDRYGLCDRVHCVITYVRTGNVFQDMDTILHEIYHAIAHAYGRRADMNEEECALLAGTAWTQVLRDNPALIQWIADVVNKR